MSLFQSPTVYSLLSCVQQNHYICAQSYATAPTATSSNHHSLFWVASPAGGVGQKQGQGGCTFGSPPHHTLKLHQIGQNGVGGALSDRPISYPVSAQGG